MCILSRKEKVNSSSKQSIMECNRWDLKFRSNRQSVNNLY